MTKDQKVITVYCVASEENGEQYVAINGSGQLIESHFSSSPNWAKNSDICKTIREKYGIEPVWDADFVSNRVSKIYNDLTKAYALRDGTEPHKHFIQWLEEDFYSNSLLA